MRPPATVAAEVLVSQVQRQSTGAAKAGLKDGDRIIDVGGTPVNDVVDALVAMASVKPGDELAVAVPRGEGKEARRLDFKVAIGKAAPPASEQLLADKLGVEGVTVTPALARKENLAVARGILVRGVKAKSPAADAGIKAGDVLYQLGPYYVNSVEDAATLLKTVKGEMDVRIGIVRGNARGRGSCTSNESIDILWQSRNKISLMTCTVWASQAATCSSCTARSPRWGRSMAAPTR